MKQKTLSDEWHEEGDFYYSEDVKEAVKKLKDIFAKNAELDEHNVAVVTFYAEQLKEIDSIFGEKLI